MIEDLDPVAELRQACLDAGSERRWADFHGINPSYVNGVLRGKAKPGAAILTALGLERVITYRRVPKPQAVQDLEARFPERVKRVREYFEAKYPERVKREAAR
jgi:hypothetical protein